MNMKTITAHKIEKLKKYATLKSVGFDVEASGLCPHADELLSIQFGTEESSVIIYRKELDNPEIREPISLLLQADTVKIAHNAVFDIKMLWSVGFKVENVFDTFTAEKICYSCSTPKYLFPHRKSGFYTLDAVLRRRLDVRMSKSLQKSFIGMSVDDKFTQEQEDYALEDIKYLVPLARAQYIHLKSLKMARGSSQNLNSVLGLENEFTLVNAEKEYVGLLLDHKGDSYTNLLQNAKEDYLSQVEICNTLAYREDPKLVDINWNSPKQKLELLQRFAPELESVGKDILADYYDVHPLFEACVLYSKKFKFYSAFVKSLPTYINKVTGRIHPSFNLVSTGRESSSKPNGQNIPSRGEISRVLRACFIAEEGWDIVGGDYAQAEVRILAQASGDEALIGAFNSGEDLHSTVTSIVYKIPLERTEDKMPGKEISYRTACKQVTFGVPYGISAQNMAFKLKITVAEAKRIIKDYLDAFPVYAKFLERIAYIGAHNYRMSSLPPYNRIRFLDPAISPSSAARQSKNMVAQGSNGDLIKLACVYVRKWIIKNGYEKDIKIILTIHDEILTTCKSDLSEMWRPKMEELMMLAGKKIVKVVPMTVDCYIAKHWVK